MVNNLVCEAFVCLNNQLTDSASRVETRDLNWIRIGILGAQHTVKFNSVSDNFCCCYSTG